MNAHVPLTRGLFALVDEADLPLLGGRKWHAHPCQRKSGGFYASASRGRNGTIYMHRIILSAREGHLVDHVNGDGLDNRRCNLRIATKSQNLINRVAENPSGYRGVSLTPHGRWKAKVTLHRQAYRFPGSFGTSEEAARAYDEMALRYHGEFARLNFPTRRLAA